MTQARKIALAAMVAAGAVAISGPALADYVRLGSVDVGARDYRDTAWARFGGNMEGLRLVADGNDVSCRQIRVQYGNGQWDTVFAGHLQESRPVNVDLSGQGRAVRQITFSCRSDARRGGARIYVTADVGPFQDQWRRSSEWNSYWSHIFSWGTPGQPSYGPPPPQYTDTSWTPIGSETFRGRNDSQAHFTGERARNINVIALRPTDNDARCTSVFATFGNGNTSRLNIDSGTVLQRGRVYAIDVPGVDRTVRNIELNCHALGDWSVRIELLVKK